MPRRRESVSRRFNRMIRNTTYGISRGALLGGTDVESLYSKLIDMGSFLFEHKSSFPLTYDNFLDIVHPHRKLKSFLAFISTNDPEKPSNLNVLEKGQ